MDAVLTAMVEDRIGPGEHTKFLIQTAREKIRFDHCVALRSPAIALRLALKTLGLERGQGVLVSALSPLYYANVIEDMSLVPVFCDVLPFTTCVSRETVEKAIAAAPAGLDLRCILLHHALGYSSDGGAIAGLGMPVIEDCSQSYGTVFAKTGEKADQTVSDFPGSGVFTILGLEERDLLTSGGGALLFSMSRRDSPLLRDSGTLPPEYGLPDMNAALAVVQFREAAKNLSKRREIARLYTQSALRTRHKRFIQNDISNKPVEYNNYAFPLILETGVKEVKAYSRRKEVVVENAFENTVIGNGLVPPDQCPEAYALSLRTVLFPLYPRLGTGDAEKVSKLIMSLP